MSVERIYSTVCSADCRASCRIKTIVKDGVIVDIQGDTIDEYNQGRLCGKGYAQLNHIYAPDRISHPMRQIGKGTGRWEVISWDEALEEIAQKIISIREKNKNLLAVCLNKYLGTMGVMSHSIEGFFNSIGYISKMIDSPCITTGADAIEKSLGLCRKPVPEDMANAKAIIIWGANPAWSTIQQMRYVCEARDKGAKLIVIDPVLTATAARADYYLQIKPGQDRELALALAKVLMEESLIDEDFLADYTNGWPEFREYIQGLDLEELSQVCEVDLDIIRETAIAIGENSPATIWLEVGINHTVSGGLAFRLIVNLLAMTGNLGVAGGNIHFATNESWDFSDVFTNMLPPNRCISGQCQGLEGQAVGEHRRIATGRHSKLLEIDYPIELLWVASHNPVSQAPDSNSVIESLQAMDMVVVVDKYMTATAKQADIFLPVASDFETEDIVVSYWHYGAAVSERAISPLGESKSDFEIMRELARTLNRLSPGFSTFPTELTASEWLDREMGTLYPRLGIKHYSELINQYKRVDIPAVAWSDRKFDTESGKFEFPLRAELERIEKTVESDYPYRLLRERSYLMLNSQYRNCNSMKGLSKKTRVVISRELADNIEIEEGMDVKIYNELGELILPATISLSVPSDAVMVRLGCDFQEGYEFNSIIQMIETDMGEDYADGKGIAYNSTTVNMRV